MERITVWLALSDSCTADAWLSVVAHKDKPGYLLVRARHPNHITDNFPDVHMHVIDHADYPYRANIPSEEFGQFMHEYCTTMTYGNFKSSVKDYDFHHALNAVWRMMYQYGENYRPEEDE